MCDSRLRCVFSIYLKKIIRIPHEYDRFIQLNICLHACDVVPNSAETDKTTIHGHTGTSLFVKKGNILHLFSWNILMKYIIVQLKTVSC